MKYRGVLYPDRKLLASQPWHVTLFDPESIALKRGRTVEEYFDNA
jgi:predicted RNase H-like HicB family nuclease